MRNYRPITLLNVDYKIMAKMLVARLAPVMDEIISPPQLGFVPGRNITEATHLLKLAQALADEEQAEGLLIAADWEKAFDRVSWQYLHRATKALGFGPNFRGWVKLMYNKRHPPKRRVRTNGEYSRPFSIKSGTPQGCPASPLIFLIVAEALTRVVLDHPDLKGVTVAGREVRLSQFADDTQFLLQGYDQLKHMWAIIDGYEDATAMRANQKKFEAVRLGATKNRQPPPGADTRSIRFVREGDTIKILGVPFGEWYNSAAWWERKYNEVKALLAAWTDHVKLTQHGRVMLANAMIYSRFRYWAQSDCIPEAIVRAIDSDVQALVWGRDLEFGADEVGTETKLSRFMKQSSQTGDRKKQLGLGLLDWPRHVEALGIRWLLRYRDATGGEWKHLLDAWLARTHEGRGAVFTSQPTSELVKSTTKRWAKLPDFWRNAIKAMRRYLPLGKAHPLRWELNDALSHPIWTSPICYFPNRTLIEIWAGMRLHSAKDLVKPDGTFYTPSEILSYFDDKYETSKRGDYYVKALRMPLAKAKVLKDWFLILKQVPQGLWRAITRRALPEEWRYSTQSVRMMETAGWTGGGIGRREDGIDTPPSASQKEAAFKQGNKSDARQPGEDVVFVRATGGHDAASTGPARGKPKHKEPISAVAEEGQPQIYGRMTPSGMKTVRFTMKGLTRATGDTEIVDPSTIRPVVRWAGKVVGIADAFFPSPKEWRLGDIDADLDKVTVRMLTRGMAAVAHVQPSCIEAWRVRIGDLPSDIGERYNVSLLTPKDWASHFKNILHRAMWTKGHDETDQECRCCRVAFENIQHWATCQSVQPIFRALARMMGVTVQWDDKRRAERFVLFLEVEGVKRQPAGWVNFHLVLWKYLIYQFVLVELEEEAFAPHEVWRATLDRFEKRAHA